MSVEQNTLLAQDSVQSEPNCFIYGSNSAIRALGRMISQIAPTDIPVLLIGESGTGKEAIALEIHRRSRQCQEAFLKFNGAELAPHLSPAWVPEGQSARTSGGTIFLDDVSKMTPASQDQLLEAMSGWDTQRSGGYQGARLISATVGNLEDEVRGGRFREELYYKINGICLRIPSLRQRSEDIPVLLDLFLKKHAAIFCRRAPQLGSSTMDLLLRHTWPGNVRELESVARKMVALGDEQLALSDLMADNAPIPESRAYPLHRSESGNGRSLKEAAREASRNVERELILRALERTRWNRKRTARELQISYKALLYKLKQLGLVGAIDS